MSDLTSCTKCNLVRLRRSVKKEGNRLIRKGQSFYSVPKGIEIPKVIEKDGDFEKKYFASWMMEIGVTCCCGRNLK